ncbi:MAG: threonine-phosphate decarboxylase [Dysgonomonas sp.]
MIEGHGDDIYSYNKEIISNFSSNVYGRQDMSALDEHLQRNIHSIHSYPEPDAKSFASLIADKNNISINNVCITNGATEAIYLIAQSFANNKTAVIIPTFSEYEDACRIHNHKLSFYEKLDDVTADTQLVWLCNPNNPNGYVYDKDALKDIIKLHPNTYFVFDQSYEYFTDQPVMKIKEAVDFKNVILLHSMTKEYTIPGLRLGYITAHPETLSLISKFRMPWSVNQLAIEAGKFLLQNDIKTISITGYLEETKRLQYELSKISELEVLPSHTHFFLCRLENKKASELKTYLIEYYGILIRDASNFRGLDEHYFRIATQSPQENDILVNAITKWTQQ